MPKFILISEDYYLAVDKIVSAEKGETWIEIETVKELPIVLHYETEVECAAVFRVIVKVLG